MIEKNWEKNVTVAVNVLFVKKEKIYPAYLSKHNSNGEKQVTSLVIANGEGCKAKSEGRRWHYLAVKKISALLRGIRSKNNDDFYFLNCL